VERGAKLIRMNPLTAQDLWPIVSKLPREEQLQLARRVLAVAAGSPEQDATRYQRAATSANEFSGIEDTLTWDADGWDAVDASR
jgi:hypothetical protein